MIREAVFVALTVLLVQAAIDKDLMTSVPVSQS